MTSNEHPVWGSHGEEAKIGWTGGQRLPWHGEAIGSFLSRMRPQGVLERERVPERCYPRGQPWTSAVTLPKGRNGLNARWMGVL
jgi:hypothetical protein